MSSLVHDCFSWMRGARPNGSTATASRPVANLFASLSFSRSRTARVPFGGTIHDAFQRDAIPSQIKDLLVYIARDGVLVGDLFRRPGNPVDMRHIIQSLQHGHHIDWHNYSFFTLANVAKKFLLSVKDGILGPEVERRLIDTLNVTDDQMRIEAMHKILMELPLYIQQLLALLFGIWFRMIYHTEVSVMSVEAVAKSVAGSVFPSCTTLPAQVELASKVMEHFITGFASPDLFGVELIQYFVQQTRTSLSRTERYIYECEWVPFLPKEEFQELFTRMLKEESEKHNFSLERDEVTSTEFERSRKRSKLSPNNKDQGVPCDVHQTSEVLTRMTLLHNEDVDGANQTPGHERTATVDSTNITFHGDMPSVPSHGSKSSTMPAPLHQHSSSVVRQRQLARLEMRSAWFLSVPGSGTTGKGLSTPEALLSSSAEHLFREGRSEESVAFYPMQVSSTMSRSGNPKPPVPEQDTPSSLQEASRRLPSPQVEVRYFIVERLYTFEEDKALQRTN